MEHIRKNGRLVALKPWNASDLDGPRGFVDLQCVHRKIREVPTPHTNLVPVARDLEAFPCPVEPHHGHIGQPHLEGAPHGIDWRSDDVHDQIRAQDARCSVLPPSKRLELNQPETSSCKGTGEIQIT